MKAFKYTNCGILSHAGFVVGVMLAINPQSFATYYFVLFGIALAICGVSAVAFNSKSKQKSLLIIGVSEIIFGLLFIFAKGVLIANFQKLHLFFAALFIVIGILYALRLIHNIKNKGRLLAPFVLVMVSLVSSLIIILYPFAQWLLWRYIALTVILQSVLYVYATFGSRAFESQESLKARFVSQLKEKTETPEEIDEDCE